MVIWFKERQKQIFIRDIVMPRCAKANIEDYRAQREDCASCLAAAGCGDEEIVKNSEHNQLLGE